MAFTAHKVAGVYPDRDTAREGALALREAGFSETEVRVAGRDDWQLAFTHPEEITRRTRNGLLIGAGVGAGIGAVVAGVLIAAEVGAVIGAPVLSVLVGACIGAIAGVAVAGVSSRSVREPDFRKMVREVVEGGGCAVIVRPSTEAGALEAQSVIARTTDKTLDQYGTVVS